MTPTRRNFLRLSAAGGVAAALGAVGHGQNPAAKAPSETGADFITAETEAAIDHGHAFLASKQNGDGSFAEPLSPAAVAITSLAGLALMAGGHMPGRGRYGRTVSKAVDFVLASGSRGAPGFLATGGGQPGFGGNQQAMYSHGFGCLFLAEVCGMFPDKARQKQVKEMLERAVAYTVAARNKQGGWRYEPRPPQADVSVTVAQMMALRAAKNAGVFVRKNVIDDGVAFIRGCQLGDGGFTYFKGQGFSSQFARSAAAIVGLYSAGIYSGREIERGLRYVMQFIPVKQFNNRELMRPQQHYFYGHYYAALAMWTAGGDYWTQWFPAIRDELLGRARSAGGIWNDPSTPSGQNYATAMSLIILQLPNNYLPILQK
ncbi:MAG TPA: twin-arginine translocation signal domain-containing protein [Urbifossiella sp.]|nr:twin-arginine translocation signal domain-containing protein [Urbifossiella sp.]